jgi:hypothetical protein
VSRARGNGGRAASDRLDGCGVDGARRPLLRRAAPGRERLGRKGRDDAEGRRPVVVVKGSRRVGSEPDEGGDGRLHREKIYLF